MRLPRLPLPVAPARHETVASYLTRLSTLHGLHPRELWEPISTPRPGTSRRDVRVDRLAAITGRPIEQLTRALPELRNPAPNWTAWRHQPQPRCPRCDARHDGGPVARLLPHHRYVCTRHRYWIGPPDAGQPATPLDPELRDVVRAQRQHLRLLRRHGAAAIFDAVLTGFLICGHLWADRVEDWSETTLQWTHRGHHLIPVGSESTDFSTSRLFAAIYPEAVDLAQLIASPTWRGLAAGDAEQQRRFIAEIDKRLGRPNYQPPEHGDAIAHWMKYDSWRPPSRPHTTFPDTHEHGSTRPAKTSPQNLDRQHRSALWFAVNRRGGNLILRHRHIQPVLVRDWSPRMDGITATIWASRTTSHPLEEQP
jgi:TniQ